MFRYLMLPALALAAGVAVTAGSSTPAHAKGCIYVMVHKNGKAYEYVSGSGYAVKMKTACKRASRECNRRMDRARKKGNMPRGGPRDFSCKRAAALGS